MPHVNQGESSAMMRRVQSGPRAQGRELLAPVGTVMASGLGQERAVSGDEARRGRRPPWRWQWGGSDLGGVAVEQSGVARGSAGPRLAGWALAIRKSRVCCGEVSAVPFRTLALSAWRAPAMISSRVAGRKPVEVWLSVM